MWIFNGTIESDFVTIILSTIVGAFISLFAVYYTSRLREKMRNKEKIMGMYGKFKSLFSVIVNYQILRRQLEIFNFYHARFADITQNKDMKSRFASEAKRRLIQMEEVELTLVKLYARFAELSASYYVFWGKEEKFEKIVEKIDSWKRLPDIDYTKIQDTRELKNQMEKDRQSDSEYVNTSLGKYFKELEEHLDKQIKARL